MNENLRPNGKKRKYYNELLLEISAGSQEAAQDTASTSNNDDEFTVPTDRPRGLEYLTRDGYVGRSIPVKALRFESAVLNFFLFITKKEYLIKNGVHSKAQENWKKAMVNGELPTVDRYGNEMPWGSLQAFEGHVQNVFDNMSSKSQKYYIRMVKRED